MEKKTKSKPLSRGAKTKKVIEMLEENYSREEIRLKLGVGTHFITNTKKAWQEKKEAAQKKLELKTKEEERIEKAVTIYAESGKEILQVASKLTEIEDKVLNIEELADKLQKEAIIMALTEVETKKILMDLVKGNVNNLTEEDKADLTMKLSTALLLDKK